MQIVGATPLPSMCMTYVMLFFGQTITSKISSLIAERQLSTATQAVIDIVRLSIVTCLIFPFCFIWAIKPCLAFVGCPEDVIDDAYRYLLVPLFTLVFGTLFVVETNFIQATGRPILAFLVRVSGMVLQVGIFTPLLAFGFRCSTAFAKASNVCGQFIVIIVLSYFIMKGKFLLKPKWRMFVSGFVKETWHALILGAPIVILGFGYSLPPNIMTRCMTRADPSKKSEIMGVMGAWTTLYQVAGAVGMAFGSGFLSSGTHALGRGDKKRMIKLFGWAALFNIIPILIFSLTIIAAPRKIGGAFLNENEIEMAEKILPIPFYTMIFNSLNVLGIMFLTAINKPLYSAVIGIVQCLFQCIGAVIMEKTVGTSVWKILHLYNFSDIGAFIAYAVIVSIYLYRIFRGKIATVFSSELISQSESKL